MLNKVNLFINVLVIVLALSEIVLVIAGATPTRFSFGMAWFCVASWVVNSWIYEHRLEKKENELAELEGKLEDAMKHLES